MKWNHRLLIASCFDEIGEPISFAEWRNTEKNLYAWACRHGHIDEVKGILKEKVYTQEECLLSALEYTAATPWRDGDFTHYAYAKKMGWLPICTAHMRKIAPHRRWTKKDIFEEAKKYSSFQEWHFSRSYNAAVRKEMVNQVCKKMKWQKRRNPKPGATRQRRPLTMPK
jgi:hypothetical protein